MQLKKLSAALCAVSSLFVAGTAAAWESENGQHATSATVELYSDYVFRGFSLSDNKPAIQGSFDYEHASGFYTGIWGTNNASYISSGEIGVYGGFANEIMDTGIEYDVGVWRYIFPGASDLNNNEVYGALGYSYFTFSYAYAKNFEGNSETAHYYNIAFDYELPFFGGVDFTAAYGYQDFSSSLKRVIFEDESSVGGYSDYYIALTKEFVGFDWTLAYTGVDSNGRKYARSDYWGKSSLAKDKFILSLSKTF
ncbi:hypothetical protein MPL1_08913 [Methylophaga lonarensis MPL]|uniref:Uncharacterized protein n=1 Tax=Methylophaga lonarensis MPL TaxID=1286106 RepID=M7NZS7_9GAMM|nr:TorF family putative porin [Methylophaga lonarensis]EMR12727.1 hypothetical protein MPL1_08913 [Methylophaga lonarensis MPL]